MDRLSRHEAQLHSYARDQLLNIPEVALLSLWDLPHPNVGVLTFNLRSYHDSLTASIRSAEFGIGVRHGCFCAHPLILRLLHVDREDADRIPRELREGTPWLPGAVRVSVGLGTTEQDIDECSVALRQIAAEGPHWSHRQDQLSGEVTLEPDLRRWPDLPFAMLRLAATGEEFLSNPEDLTYAG